MFEIAELCNFTPDEYYDYQKSQKMIYDYENTIDFAKKQGEAKGRAEGREEGRAEGRAEGHDEKAIEIARNLMAMGLPVGQIISATGLSEEQVRKLSF